MGVQTPTYVLPVPGYLTELYTPWDPGGKAQLGILTLVLWSHTPYMVPWSRAVTINRFESNQIDSSSQPINRFKTPESIH